MHKNIKFIYALLIITVIGSALTYYLVQQEQDLAYNINTIDTSYQSQTKVAQNNKSEPISLGALQGNQIAIDNWKLNLPKGWEISNSERISDSKYAYAIQENGNEIDLDLQKIKKDDSDSDQLEFEIGDGGVYISELPSLGDLYATVGTDSENPFIIANNDDKSDLFGYYLDFNFSKPDTDTEYKLLENSLKKILVN